MMCEFKNDSFYSSSQSFSMLDDFLMPKLMNKQNISNILVKTTRTFDAELLYMGVHKNQPANIWVKFSNSYDKK